MSSQKKSDCLTVEAWDPKAVLFQQPKKSKLGKDINVISAQLNSKLTLQSPLMKTWGIADFVDPDTGVSSGRFNMSLNFPNEGYSTKEADEFKTKLQTLQNLILEKAFENRLAWFGDDDMSLDVIKSKMYSILKYPKIKDDKGQPTKKSDFSKPPTLSLKVSNFDNIWRCEVYDMQKNRLFPSDNKDQSPCDFVPKGSEVIAKINCGGIWTGDKAWGVKWNLILCFVKPSEQYNLYDTSSMVLPSISASPVKKAEPKAVSAVVDTLVEDSDDEEPVAPMPMPIKKAAPVVPVAEPVAEPVEEPVVAEVQEPEPVEEEEAAAAPKVIKKKIIKKVVK